MELKDKVVTVEGLKGAYDNLDGKITQLNSDLEIRPVMKMIVLTPTTNSEGVFNIVSDFSMFTKTPAVMWNLRNNMSYPYDIFVYGFSNSAMQLRVRNTSNNSAVANTKLPEVTVYIIGM